MIWNMCLTTIAGAQRVDNANDVFDNALKETSHPYARHGAVIVWARLDERQNIPG